MHRPGSPRSERGRALLTLALLGALIGLLPSAAASDAQPAVEARRSAERVAAFRIALGSVDTPAAQAAPPVLDIQPLLAGEETVRLPTSATRIRIESVGIDAEVRPVGLVFRDGRLQYDTPRLEAADGGEVATDHRLVEGGHDLFALGRAELSDADDLPGQPADVVLGQRLQHFGGHVRAERDQQRRSALAPVLFGELLPSAQRLCRHRFVPSAGGCYSSLSQAWTTWATASGWFCAMLVTRCSTSERVSCCSVG